MSDRSQQYLLITALVTILLLAFLVAWVAFVLPRDLPSCPEDSTLVGGGNFERGRWSYYLCGPAMDDFEGYR